MRSGLVVVVLGSVFATACGGTTRDSHAQVDANIGKTAGPSPTPSFDTPTEHKENTSLFDKSPQYLCDHLAEIKQTPRHDEPSGDAIYDALKRNGYYSTKCLIEKITDSRPMDKPDTAPFWAGLTYRVGDTAIFMLLDIYDMYWPKGMLPKKYEDMLESEGVFAYYFYVHEVPGARKELQRWWRKWAKTCQPECQSVPKVGN